MYFQHTGTLTLETKRLLLRKFEYSDCASMLHNWIANPNVQHRYGEPTYETKEDVKKLLDIWIPQYQDHSFYRWAIILKENNENIGQIAFCRTYTACKTAEIEYCIGEDYWGNGYATEALTAVIRFSFENPQFQRLEAFHLTENIKSGKVLRKAGMKKVPSIMRFEVDQKLPTNEICYALTINEYCNSHIF